MVEFAAFEFDLNQLVDGSKTQTKRQAYEILEKQNIHIQELDDRPSLPPEVVYIWIWFTELASCVDKITFTEIKAWQDLKGFRLNGHEISAIMQLEQARRAK